MAKILFTVEIPPNDAMSSEPSYTTAWRNFAKVLADSTKPMKAHRRLHEGTWLLDASGVMPVLASAISEADRLGFPYSMFLIPDEAIELSAGPSRKMSVMPFPG
jgi:hypothetical protein